MQKDDATWLKIAYISFGLIVGYVLWKALGAIAIQMSWDQRYIWFSQVAAVVTVTGGGLSAWALGQDQERHDYFLNSIGELRRVTWPTFIETRRMTIVVCAVVFVFALVLAAFDFAWAEALKVLLSA